MNLFISWSGERSELVAKALHPWIKCVIQNIEPFFSPSDISGGSIWIDKLNNKLASSNAGIICLTPENQHAPWIQFEAGALAKGLSENRVFILLIGLESSQVTGPLSSFNHTSCSKEGIEKMIKNLNELTGEQSLAPDILSRVLLKNYQDLETVLESVISMEVKNAKTQKRDSSDIQNEMLNLLRGLSNRISNVEHSLITNKGLIFTNNIKPTTTLDKFKASDKVIKMIYGLSDVDRKRIFDQLNNAEIDEELGSSGGSKGGV